MIAYEFFYGSAPADEARHLRKLQSCQCHCDHWRGGFNFTNARRQVIELGNATPPAQELQAHVPTQSKRATQLGARQEIIYGAFTLP